MGSAAARVIGSSFRACASCRDQEPYTLDPDEVAALRNGHIGWKRRRGGGGGGGSANCEPPVDKDVRKSSGDDYDTVDTSATRNRRLLGIGRLAVRAAGRCMGNKLHGRLTEEDSRGGGGEGNNVRTLCRALCRVCLSRDSTHPLNNINDNDNGAATTTMTGLLLFFAALSIFPLHPNTDLLVSPPTPLPQSDPVESPPSSDRPSSLKRLSPFSPFFHYHRHRQSPSRCSSILIQTHCHCQFSIPRASRFLPSSPQGGCRPSAPRRAMCGALKTRRGCLRARTSRRGR